MRVFSLFVSLGLLFGATSTLAAAQPAPYLAQARQFDLAQQDDTPVDNASEPAEIVAPAVQAEPGADNDEAGAQAEPEAPAPPAGPMLIPADPAPIVCTAGPNVLRFLEVRGRGFEPWALQRLNGALIDAAGAPQITWSSVWVSPQGQLTVEINLCADPFRGRPALGPGAYTLAIGPSPNAAIAATTIELSSPPEPSADETMPAETGAADQAAPPASQSTNATTQPVPPAATSTTNADTASQATATPLPTLSLPAATQSTPTQAPRTGLGSRQQPFPVGGPGQLADGWQLLVTGVSPDAFAGIQKEFPSARALAADQRAFIVRVEGTYRGDGNGIFSASRLNLLAGSGEVYTQLDDACGLVPDMLPPNLVVAGGQVRGNVCFVVRAADVDSLVLTDTVGNQSERPYFTVR